MKIKTPLHRSSLDIRDWAIGALAVTAAFSATSSALASSHMDAPLITYDPPANLADVYAFVSERDGEKRLVVGLSTYPFEEPGVGPNKYNFDPRVLYELHLSMGSDLAAGEDTLSYQFEFSTDYKTQQTILQSYLGVVETTGDANQNLLQSYTVTLVDHRDSSTNELGMGVVPPNNQGIATPFYNIGNDGENPARPGVDSAAELDDYTKGTIATLESGYRTFAGQREDGFYGDVQAIFDLLNFRTTESFDSQSGFNTHMIVLEIPLSEIGGDMQSVGVHATTSRMVGGLVGGVWEQVGRLGNPLFCEALVAIEDKNLYNTTKPTEDATLFAKYAETPELAALINALVLGDDVAPTTDRSDLVGIFIPDLIRVDLSTEPARLPGGSGADEGYSRLGIFGGDTLTSQISDGFGDGAMSGGWPNGRRFGDDVIDIAVTAIISDLRTDPLTIRSADGIDNVSENDSVYSKVFPYASTPHNGRNYVHNAGFAQTRVSRLFGVSARGWVGEGENVLIGGFLVLGDEPLDIVVRGRGPSMAALGVNNPIDDPFLRIKDINHVELYSNDNWMDAENADEIPEGLAPTNDAEAAILATFEPGLYTAILRKNVDEEAGIGIVEMYLAE